MVLYNRHGQSAALQLIFSALEPVPILVKANNISLFKQNLTKFVLKSSQEASKRLKNSAFTEIVTGFERCAAPEEKLYSNLAREQKSLATPALEVQ